MKKTLLLLVCLTIWSLPLPASTPGWFPCSEAESQKVLVPGTPALTVAMQNVLLNCLEFALEVALTDQEQEAVRSALMGEFLQYKSTLIGNLQELEKVWAMVLTAPADERQKLRLLVQEALQDEVARNSAEGLGKIVYDIQKRSLELLAPGNPKIDQRSFEAFREIVHLAMRLRDRKNIQWSPEARHLFDQKLLQRIPELSPEGRRWLANAEFHRAVLFRSWEDLPKDEKETIKALMIPIFAPPAHQGDPLDVNVDTIPLPPPNLFPLPRDLPWTMRE